jgi:hypothetical protein
MQGKRHHLSARLRFCQRRVGRINPIAILVEQLGFTNKVELADMPDVLLAALQLALAVRRAQEVAACCRVRPAGT